MTKSTTENDSAQAKTNSKQAWLVTFSGTGVNLTLGIIYSWSIIAAYLRDIQGWSAMDSQLPYMITCSIFALLMVPAGRIQDSLGPKVALIASAIFAGVGLIGSGFFISVVGLSICFGILFGSAMGLGYSSATPPAIKWFRPEKRGLIAGIVVSGAGLASVYTAPLTNFLLGRYGLSSTFFILGTAFFFIIIILAQLIKNPPDGYIPPSAPSQDALTHGVTEELPYKVDFQWHEMIKTPQFYLLWLIFCFGSLAGLMVIGQLSSIVYDQSGLSLGFVLVALLAIFNAVGRIVAGALFDRLGRTYSLVIILTLQAINFLLFGTYDTITTLVVGTMVAGFSYGACLSIFPAATAMLYGVKNIGVNYGLLYTSWGAGGVFGGLIGGLVRDHTGSYNTAFLIAAALCAAGVLLSLLIKEPEKIYA